MNWHWPSLRAGFDQERVALKASLDASIKQIEQQRSEFQRERDELSAKLSQSEAVMAEFRLAFDRERDDWQSRLRSREDELAAIRVATANEHEELQQRIEALEAKREELRSAFDRISQLGVAATDQRADASGGSPPVQPQRSGMRCPEKTARSCRKRPCARRARNSNFWPRNAFAAAMSRPRPCASSGPTPWIRPSWPRKQRIHRRSVRWR